MRTQPKTIVVAGENAVPPPTKAIKKPKSHFTPPKRSPMKSSPVRNLKPSPMKAMSPMKKPSLLKGLQKSVDNLQTPTHSSSVQKAIAGRSLDKTIETEKSKPSERIDHEKTAKSNKIPPVFPKRTRTFDLQGQPLPLQPLLSHKHEALHRQYITDRDNYRAKLPTPLPRYWYDNSLRYSANVYEMQKCSSSSLASRIRIVMNKGWHGGNRIKSKKASPEDARCFLCGLDDSQAHWLHNCTNLSLHEARTSALREIQDYSTESIPAAISSALLTVLHTTDEPERIWTANWSSAQIQHFEAILLTHQAIPSTSAGWNTVKDTLLKLSRILSRTALHMWTCKVLLETPQRSRYRQLLRDARTQAKSQTPSRESIHPPQIAIQPEPTHPTASTPTPIAQAPPPLTTMDTTPLHRLPTNLRRSPSPSMRSPSPSLKRRRSSSPLLLPTATTPALPARHGVFIFPPITQAHRDVLLQAIRRGDHPALYIPNPVIPGARFTITGRSLELMQAADMSQNTSIDALFALGIPPTLAPAIQWAHTDFFTTIALTTHGYDTTVMPRCRPHLNFFRANASLTLIPISQGLHFTLLVVDHTQRQLRGYDSLYGLREYDNSMITNLRTLRRLISDEAMALGIL